MRQNAENRGNSTITDNIQATVTYYNNHSNTQGHNPTGYAANNINDTNASNTAADILQTKNLVIETLKELPANNEACLGTQTITRKKKASASEYLSSTSNFLSEGLVSDDEDDSYSTRDRLASDASGVTISDANNVTTTAATAGSGPNTAPAPNLLRNISRVYALNTGENTGKPPEDKVDKKTGNVSSDSSQAYTNTEERKKMFSAGNQGLMNKIKNKFFNSPFNPMAASAYTNALPGQVTAALQGTGKYIDTDGAFIVNYGLLANVEYFTGYGTHTNQWEPLSIDVYNELSQMPGVGTKVLCRFKRYYNEELGLMELGGMSLPMFHEYFLLSPVQEYGELVIGEESPVEERRSILEQAINYTNEGHASISGISMAEAGHQHQFILNDDGSGLLYEACNPEYPAVCHVHMIQNYEIQSGHSTNIDETNGTPPHIHKLPSDIRRIIRSLSPGVTPQEVRQIVAESVPSVRPGIGGLVSPLGASPSVEDRARTLSARGQMTSRVRRTTAGPTNGNGDVGPPTSGPMSSTPGSGGGYGT